MIGLTAWIGVDLLEMFTELSISSRRAFAWALPAGPPRSCPQFPVLHRDNFGVPRVRRLQAGCGAGLTDAGRRSRSPRTILAAFVAGTAVEICCSSTRETSA